MWPRIPLNSLHPHVPSSSLYCSFSNVFLLSTVVLLPFPHAPLALLQGWAARPWAALLGWRWGWDQGTPRICQEGSSHSDSSPLWGSRDFCAWTSVGREITRKKRQSCLMSSSEVTWPVEKAVCATGSKPCWKECLTLICSLIPWRPAVILFTFTAFHFLTSALICVFLCIWFSLVVLDLIPTIPISVAHGLLHSNQCS